MDRDTVTGMFGEDFSVASLYPMFVGMADEDQAAETFKKLHLLEHPHGICPCEAHDKSGNYQWDSPNLWPCLQWIAYKALKNYGYNGDALRIAQKYVSVVEINEAKTGQLWEKYNADSGFCDVINEYPMPPMLGWSAGVYLKFKGLREPSERREKIHGSVLTLPQTVESDQLYR
jgi:alpha,alpha-trehalase